MDHFVGIFRSSEVAENALQKLRASGVPEDELLLLTPKSIDDVHVGTMPQAHPPGSLGITAGHVVGATTGFAGGTLAGGAAVLFLLPGIGPFLATGTVALSSLIGVVIGAAAGNTVQQSFVPRLSYEDALVYIDALRSGYHVLIAQPGDHVKTSVVQDVFRECNAENLEHARMRWWDRLRKSHTKPKEKFSATELSYVKGWEAALHPDERGHSREEAAARLKAEAPATYEEEAFRQGYERGQKERSEGEHAS
ncbi:MAG: hypothetical protein AB7G75_07995 [Candidatus Binatia bacterium]